MGNRNKLPRLTHPLLVAASALSRATDPAKPSRLTVLRLLGDALYALQESHLQLTAIKSRLDAHLAKPSSSSSSISSSSSQQQSQPSQSQSQSQQPLSRQQIEIDNRFRQAHNEGARALFSVTVTALIKLPSRGGPLRRRAIDLLKIAALAAGPASAMAAVDRIRSHLNSLKRASWSETNLSDFHISAILLTLADLSTCTIASRDVARESIHFLLGHMRIQQKCRRSDLCHALAVIISSFPQHAPPDDRLIDLVLGFVLVQNSVKQGLSMFGGPLLVAIVVPFVVSRGPAAGDDIALVCARALKLASTPTERGMWALALARAVVTARRSSTYQIRKYGTSEMGSKFPKGQLITSANDGSNVTSTPAPVSENDPTLWVSNEIFEEALVTVASMTGLGEASIDSSVAIAAVLRMWLLSLPDSLNTIVHRSLVRLTAKVTSVPALSIVVDAIWLGILKHLKPSQSSVITESIMPLVSDSGLTFPAALSICGSLVRKFGRQALKESGLSTDYNTNTSLLIKRIHDALESVTCVVRLSGVQVMLSILHALPRTCAQFLTAVLQNLRIADLNIVTMNFTNEKISRAAEKGISHQERELAPLFGNGAALSIIVEKLSSPTFSVPAPLSRQCLIDALALLRPHQAAKDFNSHSPIVSCIRRRVAWGVIAGLARGKRKEIFEGETMQFLLHFWTEELKYGGITKLSKPPSTSSSTPSSSSSFLSHLPHSSPPLTHDNVDLQMSTAIDEALARSSARGAALYSLSYALRYVTSPQLEQCARALVAASAARIVSLLSNINSSSSSSSSSVTGTFMGFGTEHSFTSDSSPTKKKAVVRLVQALAMESMQLIQVAAQVPPSGDAGELCFLVAMALAEEAQRALGEVDEEHAVNEHLTHGAFSSSRSSHYDGVISNRLESMLLFERFVATKSRNLNQPSLNQEKKGISFNDSDTNNEYDTDTSWLFSNDGLQAPIAERVLIHSGRAIAAIVSEDLSAHGSLIESLPAAKLSPSLSATISLEITKRLSRSDLAEINRALAVLQVLVRRSLGISGGAHLSTMSQKRNGRLYTPNTAGDSRNRSIIDIPGILLQDVSHSDGELSWSRVFSDESHLAHLPFHNYHSRALGTMYATQSLASEAFRELSITGGPTLWIGLTQKVIETVRTNIEASTPAEFIAVSNALTSLGALLEVIPEQPSSFTVPTGKKKTATEQASYMNRSLNQASTVNDMCTQAINVIIEAIEVGKSSVQAASALALSSRSYLVASSAERIIAALLRAWGNDKGDPSSLGHFGRCTEEAELWVLCFSRMWNDMGVKDSDGTVRFFVQDSCGFGSISDSLAIGAGSVLEACRMYWWPLKESSAYAVREFATDLVQWEGNCSQHARASGLSSMISIWSAKIDSAHSERSSALVEDQSTEKLGKEQSVLPVESFSLKDVARASSLVGPFLDEVIYKALAPSEHEIPSRELRVAATFAVSELIRGLGVLKTCENLPRLPETLFAAVEERITGAQRVMDILVNGDAEVRPRYWFGLCRAITMNGERLNYGKKGTVWDTSFRTKAYSVRVSVDAIDRSMAACKCHADTGNVSRSSSSTKHTCAFGFLRKVFDFAKQISSAASFDFESCGHGCRLIQRIAARVGSVGNCFVQKDSTLSDFFEMWDPCVAMMHTLLVDRVPHGVLNSAATAASELLVSCLKLQVDDSSGASQRYAETVPTYMQALIECDLRQRLRYADMGEDIGMRAMLALIAKYGRIMSALNVGQLKNGRMSMNQMPGEETVKAMLFALCGDFVGMSKVDGLRLIAKNGGALTLAHVGEEELHSAMASHIGPIVLGAMSCINGVKHPGMIKINSSDVAWENEESVGVKMAENKVQYEGVTLATLAWLITHDHSEGLSKFKRQTFCDQAQETLECLFRVKLDSQMHKLRSEVLFCFAESNKTEALKFAERMSVYDGIDDGSISLIIKMTSSLLLVALQDEFGTFQEHETRSLCRGLDAVANIIPREKLLNRDSVRTALNVLDVLFQMACHDSVVVVSILAEENVLKALCNTVRNCLEAIESNEKVKQVCENKVWTIFENGCNLNCYAMLKVSAALAAVISDRDGEIVSDILFEMIVFEEQTHFLSIILGSHGVEDCITGYINVMADNRRDDGILLMKQLGTVTASDHSFSVAVAFRLSMVAVLADGPYCGIINKMGLVLYSMFLSILVHSLPTSGTVDEKSLSAVELESAKYFLELVEEEADMSGSFVSSLREDEREKAKQFLSIWGWSEKKRERKNLT